MTVEAPPTSLYATLADYRRQVAEGYEPLLQDVYSHIAEINQRAQERLKELNALVEEAVAAGKEPTRHWLYQQKRYQSLVAQMEAELMQVGEILATGLEASRNRAIALGNTMVKDAYGLLADIPVGIERSFATFPMEAAQQLILMTQPGPVRSVLEKYSTQGAARAAQQLVDGISLGHHPSRIAKELRQSLGISAIRATTIARTETMRAFREAARLNMMANADILEGWVWESARTKNTCAVCWAMHGTVFQFDDRKAEPTVETQPTIRSAAAPKDPALVKALENWYDFDYGSAIKAASRGQSLRGFKTPGGAVLSDEEAAMLEADAALIQSEAGRKRSLNKLHRGEILEDQDALDARYPANGTFTTRSLTAATITQEASMLYSHREGMEGATRVTVQYRDPAGVRGQVREIGAESEVVIPRGAQFRVASRTQRSDGSWLVELEDDSGPNALPDSRGVAPAPIKSPPGSTAAPAATPQERMSVTEAHGRGLIPMYTHPNCRCVMAPRPKSYADILGDPSIPDKRPPITSGADAFAKLDPATQRRILGPGRHQLYQNGMPLRDMLTAKADKDWGIVRGLKPVGRVAGGDPAQRILRRLGILTDPDKMAAVKQYDMLGGFDKEQLRGIATALDRLGEKGYDLSQITFVRQYPNSMFGNGATLPSFRGGYDVFLDPGRLRQTGANIERVLTHEIGHTYFENLPKATQRSLLEWSATVRPTSRSWDPAVKAAARKMEWWPEIFQRKIVPNSVPDYRALADTTIPDDLWAASQEALRKSGALKR